MQWPRRGTSARAERTQPLILYVVSLVALPLLGFGIVAGDSIRDNAAATTTAKSFEHEVALRSAAIAATSAVQLEQLELASVAFVREVGITAEVVAQVTGLDLDALGTLARRQVDAAIAHLRAVVAEVGDPAELERLDQLYGQLVELRSPDPSVTSIDDVVMAATQLTQFVNGLASAKTPGVNGVAVDMSLQLAAIVEITQSARDETQAMLDRFGVPTGVDTTFEAAMARHDAALAAAVGIVDAERLGVLQSARREVLGIPADLDDFEAAYDEQQTDLFEAPSESIAASAQALVSRITYFVRVSTFAVAESDDLAAQASASADQARTTMRWTIFAILSMATLCVVVAFVVIRSLVRPLHRLRDAAQRIGGGHLEREDLPLEGPREVRAVTSAMNEMAITLANVDDYLHAMSSTDSTDAELSWLPGEIGKAVRVSVDRVSELTARLRESESALAKLARYDALTGLPNRFSVMDHLRRSVTAHGARADGDAALGLMFIDVDGFKSVNDTHGHGAGDEVLRILAQRLRAEVRDDDFVARLGGDEFLVVAAPGLDEAQLCGLGERLIQAVEMPCEVGENLFVLSASVGVTMQRRDDTAAQMIERADAAVYQAKRRGRRRVELFDAELQERVGRTAQVELALRTAIASNELVLYLQPLADGVTGNAWGAEGLVRWQSPTAGLIPPNDFIPVAERSGLIYELERWVVHEAATTLRRWSLAGHDELRLAINVSGRHILDGDFLGLLDEAFGDGDVRYSRLEVELTESHLLDDVDRASEVLAELRSRGVHIAIDDFGTGYSSMTYLQRLPVDCVKIDRSFVAKLPDDTFGNTVVEAVISIAETLELDVVAEGVEHEDQLRAVLAHGVTRVQGFHLARPAPAMEVEPLLFGGPLIDPATISASRVSRPGASRARSR